MLWGCWQLGNSCIVDTSKGNLPGRQFNMVSVLQVVATRYCLSECYYLLWLYQVTDLPVVRMIVSHHKATLVMMCQVEDKELAKLAVEWGHSQFLYC